MDYYVVRLKDIVRSMKSILRWTLIASLIGLACGFLGVAFDFCVVHADELLQTHKWILYLLPVIGLAIVGLYQILKTNGLGTDSVIKAAADGTSLPLTLIPAIFISTALTHLGGGSAGREGAAFQMGGSIGSGIGKLFHLEEADIGACVMTGMAAFFAAVFGLPVTASLFVTMVISVGSLWHSVLFPELVASLIAAGVAGKFGVAALKMTVSAPDDSLLMFLRVALLAAACAALSTFFCDALHVTERKLDKWIPNAYLRALLGGAVVVLVITLLGTLDYSGAGGNLIVKAVGEGKVNWYDFILKLVITCLTLGAGYKGGEVVPSFAIGATFGCFLAPILGIPASFGAALGLVCFFGGCSNSLIAPIFLAIEMFGMDGLNYYALGCIVSYVVSGYAGFYYNQRIEYSKIAPRKIDLFTNQSHE